jgi:hypothetical protein
MLFVVFMGKLFRKCIKMDDKLRVGLLTTQSAVEITNSEV